jgi:hypothetical protein
MIKKLDKGMNSLLEVDIILPKGIVCINQELVVLFLRVIQATSPIT